MKHFVIPFMAAAMLAGCAIQSSKSKMQEADFMQDNLNVYGAYRADIVGVISWNQEDRCNKTAFMLYARKEKNIDKVVDIITKETCLSDPGAMNTNCKCEYKLQMRIFWSWHEVYSAGC